MQTTRRQFVRMLGLTGLAGSSLSLAACDQQMWDNLARELDGEAGDSSFSVSNAREIDDITHVLNRITFGPRPGDYARVKNMGVDAFIEQQLDPQSIKEPRRVSWKLMSIESLNEPRGELFNTHAAHLLNDMTRAKLLRAVYSHRQLQEVMVDFWTDHFNIVSAKDQCKWLKMADDREVIRTHALGSFHDMVRASALSPAMLIYLDGHDNKVASPEDKPNENYARELLELHTLGVHGGYSQQDVMEVARCLSGWTYGHSLLQQDHVQFIQANHDDGEKRVLGETIPAGGGEKDLDRVIDIVCSHVATANHIATKLCRRFIADDPPREAVEAVAATFARSRGNTRECLRTLFASDSFQESRGSHFKRPFRFVVSALRAVDASTDAGRPVVETLERMGHAPFSYPTPDGYPMESQPWLGTLLWRWNFARRLADGSLNGTARSAERLERAFPTSTALACHLLGRMPREEEAAILDSSQSPLALLLASPAFQQC